MCSHAKKNHNIKILEKINVYSSPMSSAIPCPVRCNHCYGFNIAWKTLNECWHVSHMHLQSTCLHLYEIRLYLLFCLSDFPFFHNLSHIIYFHTFKSMTYSQPPIFTGSASSDSNRRKILEKMLHCADVYYVVRPMTVPSLLNVHRLFLLVIVP